MLYAIVLCIIAAISLVMKNYIVARWGMIIAVCVIGAFGQIKNLKFSHY